MAQLKYRNINSNPCLNDIVYSILRSAEPDKLRLLKGRFLKASQSEKAAKSFVANSRLEEKMALMAEFGVRFFTLIVDDEKVSPEGIKKIIKAYAENQKGSALDMMTEIGLWVESDKNYAHLLGLMAQLSSHPSFKENLELSRPKHHVKRWTYLSKNKHDANVTEASESADYLSRLLLQANLITERSQELLEVRAAEMKILLYLYSRRHTHVTKDKAWSYFLGNFTKAMVSANLTRLTTNQLAEKHLTADPHQFTITSKGIGVVNRYFQKVIQQTNQ